MADRPKKQSNITRLDKPEVLKNYIRSVDRDIFNLFTYLDRFPRRFEQSAEPTIQRNTHAFWRDTDNEKFYLLLDFNGTTKKVELI